jgi:3-oxoacyl-[acyl-carrier protein] reductase
MNEVTSERPWAFVTGGSGGVGRAISESLAEDGWNIALTYRTNEAAAEVTVAAVQAAGGEALSLQLDLTNTEAVPAALEQASARGAISGVVYAAGPHIPMDFIARTSPEKFAYTIDQDLKASFNLFQAAIPLLRESHGVALAVVTPVIERYTRMDILSSAPKAALQAVIRGIAAEEGRYGVRANCIGVGMMEGEGMWEALIANGDFTEQGLAALKKQTPLGHFGHVSDVGAAAVFLMSQRSKWITGQTLNVDGGYSL